MTDLIGKLIARIMLPLFERMGEKVLRGEAGWICTNCGTKYGPPPYDIHSSWGCEKCVPVPCKKRTLEDWK
ncbi:hypothetical protein LCGC14_1127390 [marine sediment metagenome]|uniref:Uncharacterized protein n=1 Tax=marine sediment metagenome TaxID=412755 RepID=A0A0F9Q7X7_9ZZZZ